jgi:hypothetical protein
MKRLVLLALCGLAVAVAAPSGALALSPTGTVKGTVTPLASAQEVEVCVVESQPSETCTSPTANGSYVLHEVPFGGTRIEFVPSSRSRLLLQYYDGVGKLAEARTVALTAINPVAAGVDADLLEGGAITGTVTALAGGKALAEVEVCAVSVGIPTLKSCAETDAAGEYELHSLPTRSYQVGFIGNGESAGYAPWYYNDKTSLAQATPIAVTTGGPPTEIDAALAAGAEIRGTVTAVAGGADLPGVAVCLFIAAGSKPQRCSYSDEGGNYAFGGLPGGSYQVGFSLDSAELGGGGGPAEDGFESQYYDGVGARAQAVTISVLAPEVIGGVDAALSPPAAPAPAAPPPFVPSPLVAALPTIAVPPPKNTGCKKGFKKKTVKGNVRCVKQAKKHEKKHPKHKQAKPSRQRGGKKQ